MVILDEQLMGRGIEKEIARWYSGSVEFVTGLRPGTVIKDEAIPAILSQATSPTFVTINVSDFWQRVAVSDRFCVVCVDMLDSRANEIPALLKRLLRHEKFRTKASRRGCVIRLTNTTATYYTAADKTLRNVESW